jgi:hypothetical protein
VRFQSLGTGLAEDKIKALEKAPLCSKGKDFLYQLVMLLNSDL